MNKKRLRLISVVLIAFVSVALLFYMFGEFQELAEEPLLQPSAYMVYEQFFAWNGHTETDYMIWNVTKLRDGLVDLSLTSHGVNVTDGNVILTSGEANLTINKDTREVVGGSEMVAYYVGEKWPFWIETNVTVGSAVDIWYGASTILGNERIYVLGQQRDCWVVEYNWATGMMKRWFDRATGILLKIYNVLYRQGIPIVVTETAVITNVSL